MRGTMRFWNSERGFGFVSHPNKNSPDVFVHITAVVDRDDLPLFEGDLIDYEIGPGKDGKPMAKNVRVIQQQQ